MNPVVCLCYNKKSSYYLRRGILMRLTELERFSQITIQCHDAPDGDAIGAGFGLYCYFKEKGKDVRLIYGGPFVIQRSNIKMLVEKLHIPIEYVPEAKETFPGLLITADCQYGAGNIVKFPAEHVAVIDHHQIEVKDVEFAEIHPELGSCSTLVWSMMREEGYDFGGKTTLGTAFVYGLLTDTNKFWDMYTPLDMEMRNTVPCDYDMIKQLCHSNLSLEELQIVGLALTDCMFHHAYHYAVAKIESCDAALLGLVSDLLLQVDEIQACLVYSQTHNGYKLSVRSSSKAIEASDLAAYLTEGIGSGGGHAEKAGGFIMEEEYRRHCQALCMEEYFGGKMQEYFAQNQFLEV